MYALDLELPTKLGLRSFHGTRGAIRGNSRPGPLTQSLPKPPPPSRGVVGRVSSLFSLYGGGQNVPWLIPIRLFTCKFKYTAACTDKTLPRCFLTLALLTSISHILGCVVRFCLAPKLNLCTGDAAEINSQHLREKQTTYTNTNTAGQRSFLLHHMFGLFFPSFRRSFINSAIVLFPFFSSSATTFLDNLRALFSTFLRPTFIELFFFSYIYTYISGLRTYWLCLQRTTK